MRAAHSIARAVVLVLLVAVAAQAAEIRVMTSGALSAALRDVTPIFERASGDTLIIVSGGSVAGAPIRSPIACSAVSAPTS